MKNITMIQLNVVNYHPSINRQCRHQLKFRLPGMIDAREHRKYKF